MAGGSVDAPSGGAADIPLLCGAKEDPVPEEMIEYVVNLFTEVWRRQYSAIRFNFDNVLQAALKINTDGGEQSCCCANACIVMTSGSKLNTRRPTCPTP